MLLRHSTVREKAVEGLVGVTVVPNVVSSATAGRGAAPLQGPGQADRFASVLGDGDIMPFQEARDGRVVGTSEPLHQVPVGMGVESGCGPDVVTLGARAFGRSLSAHLRGIDQVVPRSGQRAEALSPVGGHLVDDVSEGGDDWSRASHSLVGEGVDIEEELLLSFEHDATD